MTVVNPSGLAFPRGYSNGLILGPGRVLFVAGQIAWDAQARIVSDDFVAQFAQAIANVVAVVREAGGAPHHVGQLTIFLKDKEVYLARKKEVGSVYREAMGKHFPTMALVQVADLLDEGAQVEIQAIAVLP